ncbi:MAG: hypothetical protein R2860_11210 [Desulfobacterales bacterium]
MASAAGHCRRHSLSQSVWIIVILLATIVGLQLFYKKTLTGKAMEANAISKRAAWIVGIPSRLMVMLAFGLSTAMGGLAGVIIAPITMSSYDMGTMLGLKVLRGHAGRARHAQGAPWRVPPVF